MFGLRRFPHLTIPEPCHQEWSDMAAVGSTRFCTSCQKYVHDFEALTRKEAQRVIDESNGKLCGRIVRDADGQIQFRREPESRLFQRLVQISALGVSALGSRAFAQEQSRKIEVRVSDQSEAVIRNASVMFTDSDGKLVLEGNTADHGSLSAHLPPGSYQVSVEVPGFEYFVEKNLQLACGSEQTREMKARLTLASMSNSIGVNANAGDIALVGIVEMSYHENPLHHALHVIRRTTRRIFHRN